MRILKGSGGGPKGLWRSRRAREEVPKLRNSSASPRVEIGYFRQLSGTSGSARLPPPPLLMRSGISGSARVFPATLG